MHPALRIGHGFDVHRLVPQRPLILGGVKIAYERGLLGHSDADVLIHALCDAILGALALGDIGRWFPDHDPRYHNADSRMLLRQICASEPLRHWQLANCDCTIIAEAPKLAAYIDAMRANLAADCGCELAAVSVKATTTEKLGFTGRGEGIAAEAVVLLTAR